jgi:excisionase family DNA binding protein
MLTKSICNPDKFGYSISEVMTALGLSKQTVYNIINDGTLKSFKVGRRRLVSPQALQDMVAKLEKRAA